MSHLPFDTLTGVTVDNETPLTVQSLLDSQCLSGEEVPGATVLATKTTITLHDEDVFTCGKCKKQFTSFTQFMIHKKDHVTEEQLAGDPLGGTSRPTFFAGKSILNQLPTRLGGGQNDGVNSDVQNLQREVESGQNIILSETDILSLSIDNGALNISTGSQVLSPLSQVIHNGTFLSSPGASSLSFKSLSCGSLNITTLEGEPIILTDGSFVAQDGILEQHQCQDLSSTGSKIIEYGNNAETTNFEFTAENGSIVEFTTQNVVSNQQSSSGSTDIVLSAVEEPKQPTKIEDKDRPVKALKLKCEFCSKPFSKNFDLQQHMRSHTGEKPFQCVVCGRAFSQKSNVKKHMATHRVWPQGLNHSLPKEPLQPLPKTDAGTTENSSSCDNGKVELLVDRSYVCQFCSEKFVSFFELKTHMKLHTHQKVYKCIQKNCRETFSDLDAFVSHSRLHSNEVLYRCHVCNKQFRSLEELGIHQYTHTVKSPSAKVASRYFRCTKCKSKFSTPEALDHHMTITTHNYPCPHCGKAFACERYLRRHLTTHGPETSFVCGQCGKGFRTEQYLNTHKLTHSTHKPHTCQHCPAAFNRRDKLVRHMLIHQTVKKFKCPFRVYLGCPKEFNRQDKLKLHILTHSAIRPSLTCRTCNKTFQRQSQLNQHERTYHDKLKLHNLTHSAIRPSLTCRTCNKIFQRQSQLNQHERTYHQVAPYTCPTCGVSFKRKVTLGTQHTCSSSQDQNKVEKNNKHQKQPRPLPSRRKNARKARLKGRNKRNVAEVESSSSDMKAGDNVPTIEIIVMPVPVSMEEHTTTVRPTNTTGSPEKGDMYHVVFPADSQMHSIFTSREETGQHNQTQDQEVPVHNTL